MFDSQIFKFLGGHPKFVVPKFSLTQNLVWQQTFLDPRFGQKHGITLEIETTLPITHSSAAAQSSLFTVHFDEGSACTTC